MRKIEGEILCNMRQTGKNSGIARSVLQTGVGHLPCASSTLCFHGAEGEITNN